MPLLKKNGSYNTPSVTYNALSDGFGLVFISKSPTDKEVYVIKDEKGNLRKVLFYDGKRVEDYIKPGSSVSVIKAKTWEELYERWALIIAVFSLFVIALEKVVSLWNWVSSIF
ncbi:MAG: hypothetical protein OEY24_08050 [Candidatus Bathyarchaeota archaeon]|nr:hypothetical protein [Candidatus Bathyarchaeota archaeon]MDH5495634.1 hypothetical protein [Candidatus Bathyarchaeota archaeon]